MRFVHKDRLELIDRMISTCDEVCLAVSFIRNSGIGLLRPLYLDSVIQHTECKVIVDTEQRMTEKKALLSLLADGFQIKHYIGSGSFHPKIWLFRFGQNWKAIVGSMNLSLGALSSNVEACVLLDESETQNVLSYFNDMWDDHSAVNSLDVDSINALPDAYKLKFHKNKPEGVVDTGANVIAGSLTRAEIEDFIDNWTSDRLRISQAFRKTGWVFRPAHGDFTQELFLELQRALIAMFPGTATHFNLDETNATRVITDSGITYARSQHETSNRDRLMKQQMNYMSKLELIEKGNGTNWDDTLLTSSGLAYKNSSPANLSSFLSRVLMIYTWFGINIYDFTKTVLGMVGDNRIFYNEYFIFLRHGGIESYSHHTPEEISNLIMTYRALSNDQKSSIWNYMTRKANENDMSASQSSFSNIVNNRAPDLFKDLSYTPEIRNYNLEYLYLV